MTSTYHVDCYKRAESGLSSVDVYRTAAKAFEAASKQMLEEILEYCDGVHDEARPRELQAKLAECKTWKQVWDVLCAVDDPFGAPEFTMQASGNYPEVHEKVIDASPHDKNAKAVVNARIQKYLSN